MTTDSKTPETDKEVEESASPWSTDYIKVSFARQLETQRDAARAEVERLKKDGERYRYLRASRCIADDGDGWLSLSFDCRGQYDAMTKEMQGEALDAAIDAALANPISPKP